MDRYTTKTIADKLDAFVQKNGLNHLKVFLDLLDYIIAGFDPEKRILEGWGYDTEQTRGFQSMTHAYFVLMAQRMESCEWYDAWGDLFMDLVGNFAGYRGQFFTPGALTDAMSELVAPERARQAKCGAFGIRTVVNDPACGSSRTLLSINASLLKEGKDKPYLIGEDLDHLCVKMSAINMCVHGCFGEVVCHDSLEKPGSVRFGYVINEGLYPFPGFPTIRKFADPARFISCRQWLPKV